MHPHHGWKPEPWIRPFRPIAVVAALGLLLGNAPAAAFDLQGHRGARGLAPENTLAAFRTALALGVTTLELDTGVTRDGVVVIAHDPVLNPALTRDAAGQWLAGPGPAIRALTLAELHRHDVGRLKPDTPYARTYAGQRAADGERIPTLAALFDEVKRWGAARVRFNIETKLRPDRPDETADPETFARAVVDVVRQHGLESRVSIQSFDWRTLAAVRRIAPAIATAALTVRTPNFDNVAPGGAEGGWTAGHKLSDHDGSVPRLVAAAGAGTWSPHHANLTPELLREAHALGLKVVPWTANEAADIARLLEWGVDGLISDYPDRVRAAMAKRGMALPAPLPAPR